VDSAQTQRDILEESFNEGFVDSKPVLHVGISAPKKYFMHYKNLERIHQQNQIGKIPGIQFYTALIVVDSCFTRMLTKYDKESRVPLKLGVVKEKGDKKKLALK